MKNLLETINSVKKCTFVGIVYNSDISKKMLKTGNPFRKNAVTAIVKMQAQFYYSYEKAANNHLKTLGLPPIFKAKKLPWGEWALLNKTISHKGETYVRLYEYEGGKCTKQYFIDGKPATAEEVKIIISFIPKKNEPKTQIEAGLESLNVHPFTLNVTNIIAWNGRTIEVEKQKVA